ncbi:nucleotidyltransferase domain-containing protein [bacterium]
MKNIDKLKKEIVARVASICKYKEIILFGSYAKGNVTKDSDIDLIIILNESGFSKSYIEKIKRRHSIAKLFYDIKSETPMDILVYTKDEWKRLKEIDNSFMKEINETGVKIA